jgi:hypothetical protein
MDASTAGMSLAGPMAGCGAAGLGLGSLVGLAVPLGLLGPFVGIVGGMVLVHARFNRI